MVKYYTPQIEPLKNGKFKYSIRYTDPSFNGVHKSSTTITKNTAHARNLADIKVKKSIKEKLQSNGIVQESITIRELANRFLKDYRKTNVSYSTFRGREVNFDRISNYFKDQKVSTITTIQINRFLNSLLYDGYGSIKKELSNSTVHSYKGALSILFKYAKQFGYIKSNPMDDYSINYRDESHKKRDRIENFYLTDHEFQTILNECKRKNRQDYYDLFMWLYLTGMRIGEGCAIENTDIYQKDGIYYAKVHGTMTFHKGKGWSKQPFTKTAAGMRDVSLPIEAVKIYKRNKNDKQFLFINSYNGNPFMTATVDHGLESICAKTHLKKHITSHIFRHTHISKLAEQGYAYNLISARVGHEESEVTRRIYTHITDNAQEGFDKQIQSFKF